MKNNIIILAVALVNIHIGVYGFISPHQSTRIPKQTQTYYDHSVRRTISPIIRSSSALTIHKRNTISSTSLQMGYNLPPSGGGGGKSDLEALIPTIVSTVLIVAFFASPLGGIFFAIFNSIFLLALLTPFVLFGGFQFWKTFYTIEEPCPSCGAIPVRVLKDGSPSVCLNCGAYSRANQRGDGLELCNNPNDMMGGSSTLFDSLFGPNPMSSGMGGRSESFEYTETNVEVNVSPEKKKSNPAKKAKGPIIDVEVERD